MNDTSASQPAGPPSTERPGPRRTPPQMATEQIDKLLLLWQDRRQQGCAAPVEELCLDCPELLPELEKRIAALDQLDGCASVMTVKVSG